MQMPATSKAEQFLTRKESRARQVLFIIDQLETVQGGAEQALLKLTRLLDSERYQPAVVVLNRPADASSLRRFACPVEILDMPRTYGWKAARAAWRLRRIIRERDVAIVQTFFESSDLWGGAVSKLSGCPALISSRRDMGFRRSRLHCGAYRLLSPLFDRVHAVSDAVRDYTIRQDRVRPSKVITIPNGVDIDIIPNEQDDFKRRHHLQDASHLVIDLTTIRRVKGIDVMIRTASRVCAEFPQAVFVVAGGVLEEDYFKELQQLSAACGLERSFRFLGGVDDVYSLLRAGDVFCHLSRNDGMSNALLEALACGLPCVVSGCGGNPGVVGDAGFVVEVEDAQAAAERVLYLLRNREEAARMGARAREIVTEKFSAQAMARRFMDLYDDVLCVDSRNRAACAGRVPGVESC